MKEIEKNKDVPMWQLSVKEFIEILETIVYNCQPEKINPSRRTEQRVYGIDGIAKIFHCSRGTAMKIKKSGIINPAIKQIGRKIVVDVDLALKLADRKGGRHE